MHMHVEWMDANHDRVEGRASGQAARAGSPSRREGILRRAGGSYRVLPRGPLQRRGESPGRTTAPRQPERRGGRRVAPSDSVPEGILEMTVADTDVLIDFMRGRGELAGIVADELQRGTLQTTVVTRFELLAGARTPGQLESLQQLLGAV